MFFQMRSLMAQVPIVCQAFPAQRFQVRSMKRFCSFSMARRFHAPLALHVLQEFIARAMY
jgi:hypothetical protein